MQKTVKPKIPENFVHDNIRQFVHCDQKVLHAPFECQYCDMHPDWQALRIAWGIAFTGWEPSEGELPCPAWYARGENCQKWGGNIPRPKCDEESFELCPLCETGISCTAKNKCVKHIY